MGAVTPSSKHTMAVEHMNSQQLWLSAHYLQDSQPVKKFSRVLGGGSWRNIASWWLLEEGEHGHL